MTPVTVWSRIWRRSNPSSRLSVFTSRHGLSYLKVLVFKIVVFLIIFWSFCTKTLQTGRSRVRLPMVCLEFFVDITLPAVLWLWGRLSLYQKLLPGKFLVVKAASASVWQHYHFHVPIVMKSGSLKLLEPSEPVQTCTEIARPLHLPVRRSKTPIIRPLILVQDK